ncbi:MAG: hypothetical protein H6767_04795 [Candidatus Peribacteria bacterium]|nr:MAG: hypothetical protein H6767_04795 [Candidatus Peribacteria bacterium]
MCLFFISIFSLFSPGKADDLGATSTGTIVPDFLIQFQNPTYLVDKDIVQDGYMCDYEKDECKVNMKFTDGSGADLSSTFGCYIDMLLESDQKERCNPNTIIFPEGEHDLHIIVYEKDLPSNTKEKYLHISNTPPVVEIPDIDIMVQSGLEQTGTGDTIAWQCKNEDCKVNLTLEHLFTGSYIANNYACTWDF